MSEYQTTGSDIVKLVRKSARSVIYFAFSPGIDAKDSWLALNKRKNASHLLKVAKREGPSRKVAAGKMALDGREVVLTCHAEIPALARKFKYFLHEHGMSFKVRVLDANGQLIDTDLEKATADEDEDDFDIGNDDDLDDDENDDEEDDEDEDDANDAADEDTGAQENDRAAARREAALTARFKSLQEPLKRLIARVEGARARALKQAIRDFGAAMSGGQAADAEGALDLLEQMVAEGEGAGPPAALLANYDKLKPICARVTSGDKDAAAAVTRLMARFEALVEQGAYQDAEAALVALKKAVVAALKQGRKAAAGKPAA